MGLLIPILIIGTLSCLLVMALTAVWLDWKDASKPPTPINAPPSASYIVRSSTDDAGVLAGKGTPVATGKQACPAWQSVHVGAVENQPTIDRAKTIGNVDVAFLGDSITALFTVTNYDFSKYGVKAGVFAVGGDTVENLMNRMCAALPVAKTYVIMIGTNNISIGHSPQQVAGRIKELIVYIRARVQGSHIVVLGVFWRAQFMDRITDLNGKLQTIVTASGDSRLHYAPWGTLLLGAGDMSDGLHPGVPGWQKVLDKLMPFIKTLK